MKLLCTTIALLLSLTGMAQTCFTPQGTTDDYKITVLGKVKEIQQYTDRAASKEDAESKAINKSIIAVYSFNSTGLLESQSYSAHGITGRYIYLYNAKGNIIEKQFRDGSTRTKAHTTYVYDTTDTGNLMQKNLYSAAGKLCRIIKYNYTLGQLAKETDSMKGRVVRKEYYYGNAVTEETTTDAEGEKTVIKYYHDSKGNKISEEAPGLYHKIYIYDEHNNKIQEQHLDTNHVVTATYTIGYVYDSQGNWTRRIEEVPSNIGDGRVIYQSTVREIEYY